MRNLSLIVGAREELVRRWLVTTLEDLGAVVEQAFCGWGLLRLLSVGHRVDLVVIDIGLTSPSSLRTLALARTIGVLAPFLLIEDLLDSTPVERLGEYEIKQVSFGGAWMPGDGDEEWRGHARYPHVGGQQVAVEHR